MPFIKRRIDPHNIRKHQEATKEIFEEHSDVANNALVNALYQLASVTHHASDIFRDIEVEANRIFKRCNQVGIRIYNLQETCAKLNPKAVQIPVSDLDTEFKIPPHLHYRSCDSVEEDLFTTDSRDPCLIHLHNLARSDFSDVFRGSQAYAKPARPKSFDPNILLEEKTSPEAVLPSKSIVNLVKSVKTETDGSKSTLPTPEKLMQIESAQHKAEIITVDTSGSQFDRRVNLRRSQKSSVTSTKRKHPSKLKERHKTLTALPDHVPNEFGFYDIHRPSSLHSDLNSNSSFIGDSSVVSGDSSLSPRENHSVETRADRLSSPVRRRLKNRHSMPAAKTMYGLPQRGARVSLHQPVTNNLSTFPRNQDNEKADIAMTNERSASSEAESNQQPIFMSEKNIMGEDRISSGFWSGTESCRHSTTSEILTQHQNVTQALQQVLSNKPHPPTEENRFRILETETNASTLSINSRLSVLDPASTLSSSMSLSHTPPTEQTSTPEDPYRIPRTESATPRQLNFSTPAGAHNFMNANFVEQPPQLPHLSSPMDLLILGSRRGNDGIIREELESFNSSSYSANTEPTCQRDQGARRNSSQDPVFSPKTPQAGLESFNSFSSAHDSNCTPTAVGPQVSFHRQQRPPVFSPYSPYTPQSEIQRLQPSRSSFHDGETRSASHDCHPVFTPNTPQTSVYHQHTPEFSNHANLPNQGQFFGPGFSGKPNASTPGTKQPPVVMDFQTELKARIEREKRKSESNLKPSLPRRQSSLRSRHKEVKEILADMEPLSNVDDVQGTTNKKVTSETTHKNEENLPNLTCQASTLSNHDGSPESSPNNHAVSSYQPSKTVAAQLQSRRPTTMYDFPLSPHSPAKTPTRPISIVEPFSKPSPKTTETLSEAHDIKSLPKQESTAKKPVPLQLASPIGRDVDVFHVSHTSTTLFKAFTPETPNDVIPISASMISPPKTSNNFSHVSQTSSKNSKSEADSLTQAPSNVPFSSAQLLAASKSLRKTTPRNEEDNSSTSPNSIIKPASASNSHSAALENKPKSSVATNPKQMSIEVKQLDIGVQTKPSPAKKPPVAAKPSSFQSIKKPPVRPKPLLSPRPNSQVVDKATTNNDTKNKQQATKSSDLKTKNAAMRAAFFSLSSASNLSPTDKSPSLTVTMKDKTAESTVEKDGQEKNSEPQKAVNGHIETSAPAVDKFASEIITNKQSIPNKSPLNNDRIKKTSAIEDSNTKNTSKTENENFISTSLPEKQAESSSVEPIPSLASSDSMPLETDIMNHVNDGLPPPTEERICNGLDYEDKEMDQTRDTLTADDFDTPTTTARSDFKASMQRLRGSYYSSSPSPTDYSQGNKSPSNVLGFDRRSQFRFSTSSLERRRKMTSNTALREDFKALLLQNLPKTNSGSQMSAAEKLKIAKQTPTKSNPSVNGVDVPDSRTAASSRVLPLSDIRPTMGASRPGRRLNRMAEHRKTYAAPAGYLSKKHPPISSSGRYYTRSHTPTRPMMAITEDSETEISPEKPTEELQRSKSLGEF